MTFIDILASLATRKYESQNGCTKCMLASWIVCCSHRAQRVGGVPKFEPPTPCGRNREVSRSCWSISAKSRRRKWYEENRRRVILSPPSPIHHRASNIPNSFGVSSLSYILYVISDRLDPLYKFLTLCILSYQRWIWNLVYHLQSAFSTVYWGGISDEWDDPKRRRYSFTWVSNYWLMLHVVRFKNLFYFARLVRMGLNSTYCQSFRRFIHGIVPSQLWANQMWWKNMEELQIVS